MFNVPLDACLNEDRAKIKFNALLSLTTCREADWLNAAITHLIADLTMRARKTGEGWERREGEWPAASEDGWCVGGDGSPPTGSTRATVDCCVCLYV